MSQSEWYEKWFQEDYLALYPNRDEGQAQRQVESILQEISLSSSAVVYDLGCGSGRHLRALQSKFELAFGMDLSEVLLREAHGNGTQQLIRGDFRNLPFAPQSADLVCSFFSSFGYLKTPEQDWAYFNALASLVKPEGYLFLDLPNGPYNVSHLPPDDEKVLSSGRYIQKRSWDGECIRKKIYITRPDGSKEEHQEQLRLFSYKQVEDAFIKLNFEIVQVFGDENGQAYNRNNLPRMSFLVRKLK